MIKIEKIEVFGHAAAIRGMRNPLESWDKSDSNGDVIGEKDLELALKLIKGGSEHRKFLRYMTVTFDITAPLYFWKEFDTYKIGTTANSTSTMHKLHSNPITYECFSIEDSPKTQVLKLYLAYLEYLRLEYLKTKDKKIWRELIQLLPSSWNQTRTVVLNFEVILNMLHQRENHKLTEWREFCDKMLSIKYIDVFYKAMKGD